MSIGNLNDPIRFNKGGYDINTKFKFVEITKEQYDNLTDKQKELCRIE